MRIGSERYHNRWHPDLEPVARVAPGAEITLEARAGLDGKLDRSSTAADLANVVCGELDAAAWRDLVLGLITLKYTQSNSVGYALDGQMISIGAGQQSRIHCTRLAGSKADRWFLRQHPSTLSLPFKPGAGRPEQNNAIDLYLEESLSPAEEKAWLEFFPAAPRRLTADEKRAWLGQQKGVSLASDAFFPFRDNVDRASQSGVKYISQPGGSVRDDEGTPNVKVDRR